MDRYARGAAWMDSRFPGWYNRVNPETIDPDSDKGCVVGQATGSFGDQMDKKFPIFTRFWSFMSDPKFEEKHKVIWVFCVPPLIITSLPMIAWGISHGFLIGPFVGTDTWQAGWRREILARIHRDADRHSRKQRPTVFKNLAVPSDLSLSA